MRKLILLITLMLVLYPLKSPLSQDELKGIDERISVIEKRLEFIRGKEKDFEDITKDLNRGKYTVLIRRERELRKRKEELSKEIENLLDEKNQLMSELDELRKRRKDLAY